jgi:arylsulfatase A-like enzyme
MPDEWRRLYRHEIRYAMDCLDVMLGRLIKFATKNEYLVLVCSSIGQAACKSEATSGFMTIVDLDQFMTRMGLSRSEWIERHAMVPCVSVTVDPTKADVFEERLRSVSCDGQLMVSAKREVPPLSYDRSGDSFHLFVYFERYTGQPTAEFAAAPVPFEWLGWGFHEHQDNIDCSARHIPHGLLLVNDPAIRKAEGSYRAPISTLDIAPTLLDYFGVPVPNYMHSPDLTILNPAVVGTNVAVTALGGGVEETVKRERVQVVE